MKETIKGQSSFTIKFSKVKRIQTAINVIKKKKKIRVQDFFATLCDLYDLEIPQRPFCSLILLSLFLIQKDINKKK